MKPFIIPIFLPQIACPYRCIYCHQPQITQTPAKVPDQQVFASIVETGLSSKKRKPHHETEIAFFGGTFTNLPVDLQERLLSWAGNYMGPGRVNALRLSTRPDALSEDRIACLLARGVKTIELGVQTLNDDLLALNNRGHDRRQAIQTITLLKKYPLKVGVQLMVGLPGDSRAGFLSTIEEVIALRPDMVRLYPTLVFAETPLAQWFSEGRYHPLSLEEAVSLCSQALLLFEKADIPVIRLGLQDHPGMSLGKGLLAGPFHPAFGFLARSHWYLNKLQKDLGERKGINPSLMLHVSPEEVGYLSGDRKKNLNHLIAVLGLAGLELKTDPSLSRGHWRLEECPASQKVSHSSPPSPQKRRERTRITPYVF